MNKRLKVLLGILAVVLCLAGVRVMNTGSVGSQHSRQREPVKNENRDHLRVSALYPINYQLRSTTKTPFRNPLLKEPAKENQATPAPAPINDMIPVTPPVMQRPENEKQVAGKTSSGMKLKAIASSGDKRVAVVEANGKVTTAFIGSAVGTYIVTDISESQVQLQDFKGNTVTLGLVS